MSDERYGIPTIRLADAQSRHSPVWRYRFDAAVPGISRRLAGGHGMDQAAVWSAHRFEARDQPGQPAVRGLHQAIAAFARGEQSWCARSAALAPLHRWPAARR